MDLIINDNMFFVKCVISTKDIQKGMMGKRFDGSFDGMLFFMDDEPHSFWMKNCLVHLDIIFINDDEIIKIHHNCKPCHSEDCEHYSGEGDMILELPSNTCKKYNIKEEDLIELI
jgi:uncharacterized membrane protein (UPF0127 family)